jgi:hypothetical protein
MKRLNVQLSDKEHEEIKKTSLELERSMNDCIRESVREFIDKHKKS